MIFFWKKKQINLLNSETVVCVVNHFYLWINKPQREQQINIILWTNQKKKKNFEY